MKNKKIKILILIICILLTISLKLYLELEEYKDMPRFIPYHNNPLFVIYALEKDIDSVTEYEQWIAAVELEQKWKRDITLDESYQKYTWEWCQMLGLDYDLILALMYHESRFDVNAYSRTNDIGLMQVNQGNKQWVNELAKRKIDLWEPYDNILAGLLIYKHYEDYWINKGIEEDLFKYALNSYNMGIGGFTSAGYPINRSYSRNILSTMEEIQ